MSLSAPTPVDPYTSSAIQQQFSGQNLVNNALINDVQQQTPYGSMGYQYTETPSGIPEITATQSLSGPQQGLLNQYQGTQGQLGQTAGNLAQNTAGMYSQPPNFMSTSSPQVQQMMGAFNQYMAPTYQMQESNLDSKLANQGLAQGGQAWTNAERGQAGAEQQAAQSALMNFEPQAFGQAVQQYDQPLQTLSGLFGASAPQSLNSTFYQQPQTGGQQGSQAPNYQAAAANQFSQQQQNFQNTISGIGQLGNGLLSGSGGLSGIGSGIAGLFGGAGAAGGGLSFASAAPLLMGLI